jgi:hypothetical protein
MIPAHSRLTTAGWRRELTRRGAPTGFWFPPEGPDAEQPRERPRPAPLVLRARRLAAAA